VSIDRAGRSFFLAGNFHSRAWKHFRAVLMVSECRAEEICTCAKLSIVQLVSHEQGTESRTPRRGMENDYSLERWKVCSQL
jgi:hypothetical protein